MNPKDTLFFAEMYSLVKKMEETIDEFEMKERVLASIVVGVIDLRLRLPRLMILHLWE